MANGFFAAPIFTGRRNRRSLLNADTGASLFYTSFAEAEAEYFQPCNALAHLNPSANSNKFELVPCMRTADRLRPIFQTGTAGIRSPRSPFFHRGRSAGPRC